MPWFERRKSPAAAARLYVVYDTGGAGRLVGVFDDEAHAQRVVDANPAYYRLTACVPNAISDAARDWAAPDVRARLPR